MTKTMRRNKDESEWDESPYTETILLHTISETVIIGKEARGIARQDRGNTRKEVARGLQTGRDALG